MRVTKSHDRGEWNQTVLTYPKWPNDGTATATIKELENGEAFDITLDGVCIELTFYQLETVCALAHMYKIESFMERHAQKSAA